MIEAVPNPPLAIASRRPSGEGSAAFQPSGHRPPLRCRSQELKSRMGLRIVIPRVKSLVIRPVLDDHKAPFCSAWLAKMPVA